MQGSFRDLYDKTFSSEEQLCEFLLGHSEDIKRAFGYETCESESVPVRETDEQQPGANPAVAYCKTLDETRKRKRHAPARKNKPLVNVDAMRPRCYHCGSHELHEDQEAGDLVCTQCATCTPDRLTTDAFKCMHFDDYGALKSSVDACTRKNFYKRINYFNDLLSQLLGRQNAHVPDEVLCACLDHLDQTEWITGKDVKRALKKARLGRYYEHAHLIANKLTDNRSLVDIDHLEEGILQKMFHKVQRCFDGQKGVRKNCLNYAYVLWQLCRLIGRTDVCDHLDMLKCKARLKVHDELWKDICAKLDWRYIPVIP